MPDDIFSRLFELFNQPGPVNLRLAAELARHLAGEREPVDPWAAEEYRELTRLAEWRVEEVAPFSVVPAPDVLPVDSYEWAERNLEGFAYLAEPFAGMVAMDQVGPAAELLRPLSSAMVGLQIGSLVGGLSRWVMATFDAGVPTQRHGPMTYVVPVVERFAASHGLERRNVRLWAALSETAHRALFTVPFVTDRLVGLVEDYAGSVRVSPDQLGTLMQRFQDPTAMEGMLDDQQALGELFDSAESRQTRRQLEAFLGLTSGYTRLLVERAGRDLLPDLERITSARDSDREEGVGSLGPALGATFVSPELIAAGLGFCLEVERRYGEEALRSIWGQPGRFPSAEELDDPVAWAARVLLDDIE